MNAIIPALTVLFLLLLACERKAPGPAECEAFGEIVMTVTEEAYVPAAIRQKKYQDHVRRCLTTPYDDEFIACVVATRRYRPCQIEFELRKTLER